MRHHILLIIHLITATIWVGGHLILLIRYVPKSLKLKKIYPINNFRKNFEPIGMPSLLILLFTGVLMAYDYDITITKWFSFKGGVETIISLKLFLFLITITLALSAVKFIFPNLKEKPTFVLIVFITIVTLIAITMLILGSFVRQGGI